MISAYIGMMQAICEIESDARFRKSIKDMPTEEQMLMHDEREKAKEKAQQEATIERRHREKCNAIVEAGRLAGRSHY